jgi:metallo-beta-lactamase family protein
MKIIFWGATGTVTGSMHELRVNGQRILLDCGLYQGRRKEAFERNSHLPVPAASINAVLLSHAHIDHSGNLPTLAKNGYDGPIYATPATTDLCGAMLLDSAHLQEKDALFLSKRHHRRKLIDPAAEDGGFPPLYSTADAERTLPLFRGVPHYQDTEVAPDVVYRTYDAGHMLGSTAMVVETRQAGRRVRLAFSGDVGRPGLPIIRDPDTMPEVDYLIMESTYGDRLHQAVEAVAGKLAEIVSRTAARGGKLIVPAFAVGRTQQLVLLLHELIDAGRIPAIPIFVDSPLAINVTEIFRKHIEHFDEETRQFLQHGDDPFGFSRLRYVREVAESKALNDLHGPYMIISASGMCEGGRILHHLANNIENPRNTILIVGFMAQNTLGRRLADREQEVKIFGQKYPVKARVKIINAFSAHADYEEIKAWTRRLDRGRLKGVFLVHGEPDAADNLKKVLTEDGIPRVEIMKAGQEVEL